nr:MAG: RNA-dependent RNA polymerase [Chemarfal virus 80]
MKVSTEKTANPHQADADVRSLARKWKNQYVDEVNRSKKWNLDRYSVGSAPIDFGKRSKGERGLHAPYDIIHSAHLGTPCPENNRVVDFIDVVDYLELSDLKKFAGHIMVVFHLRPERSAWETLSGYGMVNEDGTFSERFNGGSRDGYKHRVWDFSVDVFSLPCAGCVYFYSPVTTMIAQNREFAILVPMARVGIPYILCKAIYGSIGALPDLLRRMERPVKFRALSRDGKEERWYLAMIFKPQDQMAYVSICCKGDAIPHETRLPMELWYALRDKKFLDSEGRLYPLDAKQLATALGYDLSSASALQTSVAISSGDSGRVNDSQVNFSSRIDGGLESKDARARAVINSEPLAPQGAAPVATPATHDAAVKAQLAAQKSVEPPQGVLDHMDEFVDIFVPAARLSSPRQWSFEEINEYQKANKVRQRKNQQVREGVVNVADPKDDAAPARLSTKTFIKPEARSKARTIFEVPKEHSLEASSWSLPLAAAMKANLTVFHWFIPGMDGQRTATAVVVFCKYSHKKIMGGIESYDIEKMDGSYPGIGRRLLIAILQRVFGMDNAGATVIAEAHCKIYASKEAFENFMSNMSGSPWTTLLNTILCAFLQFAALRRSGFARDEAWERIGPCSGDDGLCCASLKDELTLTFQDVGMTVKWEVKPPQFPDYCVFLNRVFFNARGSQSSMPNVDRFLRTLNTSVGDKGLLPDRLAGWRASDPHQPIINAVVSAYERVFKVELPDPEEISKSDRSLVFKMSAGA